MASKILRSLQDFVQRHRAEFVFVLSSLSELDLLAIYALGIDNFPEFDQMLIKIVLCVLPIIALSAGVCCIHKRLKRRRSARA